MIFVCNGRVLTSCLLRRVIVKKQKSKAGESTTDADVKLINKAITELVCTVHLCFSFQSRELNGDASGWRRPWHLTESE